jgi:glycine/D-amino acid oxidase-like deaminating enzyme
VEGIQASALVFCEGYRMRENPWFNFLPLQPDKGEFLQLHSDRTLCRHIINGAHMLIPLGGGRYRFGATHEHGIVDHHPTEEARQKLQAGLQALLEQHDQIRIEGQSAGVRPATSDRQPFIGQHPYYPALHLFNGFGARGALSIPWFAEQFSAHLLHGQPLPEEADLQRYQQLL